MERITITNTFQRKAMVKEKTLDMKVCIPPRGTTGPVRIGRLIEPLQQLINHPGRNRLMAELFKDYKKDYR